VSDRARPGPGAATGYEQAARRRHRRPSDALAPSDLLIGFFALGVLFLVLGAAVAVLHAALDLPRGRWLALHLVFLGGVSQLVLGAAQFFVGAFLATDPPRRALVRGELLAWNGGVLVLAAGVLLQAAAVVLTGTALLWVALGLFTASLREMERRSLQRAVWATRWYYACAFFLALGLLAGALQTLGLASAELRGAHLALNIGGWFGVAIVGTLHTLFPSLTNTLLRHPRLQGPTFATWCAGVIALTATALTRSPGLAAVGWALLLTGSLLLATNLLASARRARELAAAGRLVGLAQTLLPLGLGLGLVATLLEGAAGLSPGARTPVATLLLGGWIGLTVLGSLLHLLAILHRIRGRLPASVEVRGGGWTASLAVVAAAALACGLVVDLQPLSLLAGAVLVLVYAVLGFRVAALALRALRAAPVRI
jgi:nitrite reductase (NO-forming)